MARRRRLRGRRHRRYFSHTARRTHRRNVRRGQAPRGGYRG